MVDDEEIVRRMAKSALQRYGYAVLVAENGQDAVDIFQALSDRISLVLLDLTMPVMSGEEALPRLQAKRPDVQVILSSGYNEVEAIRRFSGKTLAGFIQKPYTAAQLAEKVKTVLAIV
ncbi:MAG: response regulator [Bryobacteraceae bacterium]